LVDFEQNLVELSALADACLQYALEVALRKHKLKTPPFVIIGLGKLGGVELTYGSDLDVTFVADPKVKDVSKLLPLAIEVMELLSAPTESGRAFSIDARLRPDGEKGLLVNTLAAYEEYYRHRAHLWEIQALTRTRPIAGDLKLGERFQMLAAELTNFAQPPPNLAAYSADWKQQIAHMRERIEKERTPPGKNALAIKTGTGGLIDAEFLAQTICLARGWQEPNTLRALERARDAQALARADAELLIENYRQLRRVEGILRRWSYEGEVLLPDDPAPMYRVAVRCGFRNAEQFMRAVESCRRAIRSVYARVMGEAGLVMRNA
jgi:glutamate-ammonia-ligase adenylyltransferase